MIIKFIKLISAIIFTSYVSAFAAEPSTVTINKPRNTSTYMFDLMKLALSYSDKSYSYHTNGETLTDSAQMEALLNGDLSVMWAGTSEQREKDYIPIRIDGYRGVMGMRFLIIRKGDQARFDQIRSVEDLKSISFGQGVKWSDTEILRHAGLRVETAAKKEGLFYMLDGNRFDAFPRGATQAWDEVDSHSNLDLTVEKGLIIYYVLPTYFFVHRGRPELAKDIEKGLERALVNGSFDKYFYNSERVKKLLKNANLQERRIIKLHNPFLPATTPLDRPELWLTVDDLEKGAQAFEVIK